MGKTGEKLKYGLLGDQLVHIADAQRGLACGCVCPHCKGPLTAKKGSQRAIHFAHHKLSDCNHGTETALHLMAKRILVQTRKLFVPYLPKSEYDFSRDGKVITFDSSVPEKQFADTIRGDVALYRGESVLNVEIKVTHEVDAAKTIELFNLGIPTVEIDLSDLGSDFTAETLEQRILSGEQTHLIYSPKCREIFAKRILGEWKTIHKSGYVDDCPSSGKKAYFFDYRGRGGSSECHECWAYPAYLDHGGDKLLCLGCLDGVRFNEIEKILELEKEEQHIRTVKLLMSDGSILEKTPRRNTQK